MEYIFLMSRNIIFSTLIHLPVRKSITMFKAPKQTCMNYFNHGFRITNVHMNGNLVPLQALIHDMLGGAKVNPSSASEHVTEI